MLWNEKLLSLFALGYLNQIYPDTDKNDSKRLHPTETILPEDKESNNRQEK